jgi:hypothetical protein
VCCRTNAEFSPIQGWIEREREDAHAAATIGGERMWLWRAVDDGKKAAEIQVATIGSKVSRHPRRDLQQLQFPAAPDPPIDASSLFAPKQINCGRRRPPHDRSDTPNVAASLAS